MSVKQWVESSVRTTLTESLREHPSMIALLEELHTSLPQEFIAQAEKFEDWVLEAAMAELKTTIEAIDPVALATALLSNQALQRKVAVPLNDIASGFAERLKAEIQQQITNETQQIHNLLAARRAKDRADRQQILKKRDELTMRRDVAFAQGQLLWLRLSSLSVAVPALLIAVALGMLLGLNYPINVLCHKGDYWCHYRWGAKVEQ
ncbi:MAG TPA: hypothetical protein V6D19_22390 [Stenomitos sp.]